MSGAHDDRTRVSYDLVAADYAELLVDEIATDSWHVAVLSVFAAGVDGPVLEVGCGPGRVAAHLAGLGLRVSGVDLSPGMVAEARRRHPGIGFEVGTMAALATPSASLGGVVSWYSFIHVPPDERPAVLAELRRVLVPGGSLLLAFQVGDELRHVTRGYGHDVDLDAWRLPVPVVQDLLRDSGFRLEATLVREIDVPDRPPQAFLLARAPA